MPRRPVSTPGMRAVTGRNFNPATRTMSGLPCRGLHGTIQTCPTGSRAGMEILKRGTGRPHRATREIIPTPGVLPRRAIRRPFGIRPRAEIPRPFGIRRLQVPGVAEDAVVAAGTAVVADTVVVAGGTVAVVECIPAVAEDTLAVAWPTAVVAGSTNKRANLRILLQKQTKKTKKTRTRISPFPSFPSV